MRSGFVRFGVALVGVLVTAGLASAGGPCRACRGSATHAAHAGTGCGPRVWGPVREPVDPIDQCDACAGFQGCNGYRQMPELLAPWQLPPGRGFRPPESFGYLPDACGDCASCGPLGPWPRIW